MFFPSYDEKKIIDKTKEIGTFKKYQKNSIIFQQGCPYDKFCLIIKGRVKLSTFSEKGNEKIMTYLNAGHVFMQTTIFFNAIAFEDTELYYLDENQVLKLIKDDSNFSHFIIANMSKGIVFLCNYIKNATFYPPKDRILTLFNDLLFTYKYNNNNEWIKLRMDLSHDDIAKRLGINRVTVSKVMAELRNEGIVKSRRGEIWLNKKNIE